MEAEDATARKEVWEEGIETRYKEVRLIKENKWIKNFLEKLSEANKKEYGDKALDCCELNKSDKNIKINNMEDNKVKSN